MLGRRRPGTAPQPGGARHAAGHAPRVPMRGLALLVAGGVAASSAAVLLAGSPASAEAGKTTATLTLLGIRDSNCDFQTGGTTAYVAPGGDVTFKAELAGLSIKVPVLGTIPISSSQITSFKDSLVFDGHKKHVHTVTGTKAFAFSNVRSNHSIAWSAESIQVTVPVLGGILGAVTGHKSISVPLNASTVTGLPAGAKLDWVGTIVASSKTECGIAEVPGVGASVGPIHVSIPPVTNLPSQPDLGGITSGLPIGGGGGGSSTHAPGSGSSSQPTSGGGGGGTYSGMPTPVPARVVPNAGSGGDSAFQFGDGGGGVQALPDTGGGVNVDAQALSNPSTGSSAASSDPSGKTTPVGLATDATDGGLGGAQLPVLLAIVAIIALSLVTAAYARMYLLRRPTA